MNINLGDAARELRQSLGIKQREAAVALEITDVHLCNIEKNRSIPSPALLEKFRQNWGVDLYVYAWCQYGNLSELPPNMQKAASTLTEGWKRQLRAAAVEYRTKSGE